MPDGVGSAEERFEYDADLNIRAVLAAEQHISQQQQAGRVVSRGDCEYRYDAAGRLTDKRLCRDGWRPQRWRYRWNAHSQLSEFITPGGERWRYAYDPFGRRIRKEKLSDIAAGTRPVGCEYQWSGDQLIAETPLYADGRAAYEESIHWLYAPGGLTPVARQEKGKLHYVVSDHMGTPRELLTEQGKRAWAGRLSLWGKGSQWAVAANDAEKLSCNLRFAGQYADEESGLHYNRFRYYDTETGQYLTPDPIGLAGGVNPYGYVHNPLGWVDPLGLNVLALPAPTSSDPWGSGASLESALTPKGGITVEMAMSPGQTSPGGWATVDYIPDVNYVRNQLAVIPGFKPEISHVQEFHIPEGIRIQTGPVGLQIYGGVRYPGGGSQIQILNYADRAKLSPVGEPRKIYYNKCGC